MNDDEWWEQVVQAYKRAHGFMTMEEAKEALEDAPDVPLTEQEIDEIVRRVVAND